MTNWYIFLLSFKFNEHVNSNGIESLTLHFINLGFYSPRNIGGFYYIRLFLADVISLVQR